ncbi:MAG: hypothetical protein IT535_14810 [Bauldia sp.]|nr:hypothetical protein [Bauldia sp.]
MDWTITLVGAFAACLLVTQLVFFLTRGSPMSAGKIFGVYTAFAVVASVVASFVWRGYSPELQRATISFFGAGLLLGIVHTIICRPASGPAQSRPASPAHSTARTAKKVSSGSVKPSMAALTTRRPPPSAKTRPTWLPKFSFSGLVGRLAS